ncbi:glycosyltransferase family 4 protein [Crocosphaera watsonii]|uniref:Glycosyltransferase n=2 Tax=Crocosphaera watsonii TaxID=263511 RepID=T2JK82_CROWT|nr:glycosyltransferase family 4 protein [Crocosphaera watsonii]CCQ54419.1 Unknown, probable lipopolysaccharide biosynthesis protein [Crocosphaera watsonii WH 0005]CCQ65531.1 Glycosyltransferase [Crocosphaera watsonii WH 0402]
MKSNTQPSIKKTFKIVHITSVHTYEDTRILLKECSSLASNHYKTYLVAPNAPLEGCTINKVNVIRGIKDIHINRVERVTKSLYQTYKTAKDLDADLYHFHDPELIPVGLSLKNKGKKVIYDVHEDLPRQTLSKDYIPQGIRTITSFGLERIENFAVKYFDALVTATPHIRDRFLKLGCHAVDINNYPIISELHIPNLDWQEKEKAVCYVGGITEIRGIFTMIEAMSQVDGALLLGGNFFYSQEQEQAKKMKGWSNVKELGYLNRMEVGQTLAKSMAGLVVLHPTMNYLDSLPVKMFEYMSAGLPVIASNFPLWKEIIEGNNCGICVDPLDTKEISQAIQWIFEHPQEAQKMGKNARRAVENKYNWENEAKKLLSLYERFLKS